MPYKLVIANHSFHDLLPEYGGRLEEEGIEFVDLHSLVLPQDLPDLMTPLEGCQAVCVNGKLPGDDDFFARVPELEHIAIPAIGYDLIDLDAATRAGVVVTNCPAPEVIESVADQAFALILSVARQLPQHRESLQKGVWIRGIGTTVWRKTIGIMGLGRIGKGVARRARGFDMRILATDPVHDEAFADQCGVEYVAFESLLEQSDFVVLCLPGGAENENIIGREALARMKPTASLINVTRFNLVDDDALVEALESGRIAGAGIDAIKFPPELSAPIYRFENALCLPHLGNRTREALAGTAEMTIRHIVDVKEGRRPGQVLNPEVYERGFRGKSLETAP